MADRSRIPVYGRDGVLGWLDPLEQTEGSAEALVRLESGQAIRAPKDLLISQPEGGYFLPMSREQFAQAGRDTVMVIPVLAEELEVSKRLVTSGRVRITKQVHEREEVIDNPTLHEEVHVERVPVDREVAAPPEVRYEGDTLIIPVLEEVLVVEKRLILKEEVRVTRTQREVREPQSVTLREEDVQVQRHPGAADQSDSEELKE